MTPLTHPPHPANTPRASASTAPRPAPAETIDDQVAWFLNRYSDGFQSPLWRRDVRGEGVDRRLKRHRGAAIAEASELLTVEALRPRLAAGDFTAVVQALIRVLSGTTLVPIGQARRLSRLDVTGRAVLAEALVDHLRPGPEGDTSFGAFVAALAPALGDLRASWSLVTAARALVFPERHVCVIPGKFALQAGILTEDAPSAARPCARDYLRYRALAVLLERRLRERGLAPRDLVDVLDFMRTTLSARARFSLAGAAERRAKRLGRDPRLRGVA